MNHDLVGLEILRLVAAERKRQYKLLTEGRFSLDVGDPNVPEGGKMMVLAEEFGEVAKAAVAIYDPKDPKAGPGPMEYSALLTELIQLAAVACAWAEAISKDDY
ncbi:MAG: hypothetical protein KGL39_17665 [Patescibacteria group bacterium]|nr:hypothetical protein [Patescibacteria group bacterium]